MYDSFASSSIFKSTNEFYSLYDSKSHQKKQPSQLMSSEPDPVLTALLLHPPTLTPFNLNPYNVHFEVSPLIVTSPATRSIVAKHLPPSYTPHFYELHL
jgi:hypothetical protein